MHASPLGISSWLGHHWAAGWINEPKLTGVSSSARGGGGPLRVTNFWKSSKCLDDLWLPVAHPPALTFRGAEAMDRIVNAADWQAVAGDCIHCRNQTWEPPSPWGKQVEPICSFKPPKVFTSLLLQTEVTHSLLRDSQEDPLMSQDSTLTLT